LSSCGIKQEGGTETRETEPSRSMGIWDNIVDDQCYKSENIRATLEGR
jgi:hypothetical protein